MGQSTRELTLFDGTVLDLEDRFPSDLKRVAFSVSSGVESTALALLLIDRYGAENVTGYTAYIPGRRNWESKYAVELAEKLGFEIHVMDDGYRFMTPEENTKMRLLAYDMKPFDAWFAGGNKLRFSPTFMTPEEALPYREQNIYLPFIDLLKEHTIDICNKMGRSDLLYASHSCTTQGGTHCGTCYCCWERARGFGEMGERDKATYDVPWAKVIEGAYDEKNINKNW